MFIFKLAYIMLKVSDVKYRSIAPNRKRELKVESIEVEVYLMIGTIRRLLRSVELANEILY